MQLQKVEVDSVLIKKGRSGQYVSLLRTMNNKGTLSFFKAQRAVESDLAYYSSC